MRRSALVASAVLTAVFALVALPGLAGSRTPSPDQPMTAAALQAIRIDASADGSPTVIRPLDPSLRSAGYLVASATLIEPPTVEAPSSRPKVKQPRTSAGSSLKPPRYTLSGWATWYSNGTTAMRLPRGTTVVICGSGGCVERVVNDYGPRKGHQPVRIVDLMPSDFVNTCDCALWKGTQYVTVRVY